MKRHPHFALFHRIPFSAVPASLLGLCFLTACGSGGGTVADQPLVIPDVSAVSVGDPTCPAGGVRVDLGVDDNRDGDLDSDEIDSTSYVCNGTDMVGGEDNVLVRTVDLPLGDTECPAGGRRLDVGLDNGDGDGTADNDVLEDDEVDTSFLDCNGSMTVVVTPPTGTPGTFVLDTHGGASANGGGGTAGNIEEDANREVVDSHLMIANTGTVDASCTPPTLTLDLGSVPAEFTDDTTIPVVDGEGEASLADGDIFLRDGNTGLFVWDDTNGVGRQVTGLRVAADATVTLAHNNAYGPGGVGLGFARDVDVVGGITTLAAGGVKGYLDLNGRQVRFAATSSVDLRGSNGDSSGSLSLRAQQDLLALGSIDTTGHSSTAGRNGGDVDLDAEGAVYAAGTIVTAGGDASGGGAGSGGGVELEASTRLICNAADITTTGGDADGDAGDGGYINFGDDCIYGSTVEIRNSGDLVTRGGSESGACDQTCSAGDGGPITFIAVQSGSVASNATLDTRGGSSANGAGGDGGEIRARPGYYFESVQAVSIYEFTGAITTFGGDGETSGGSGGRIMSENQGALGSATRFLGYASALLDGGDGAHGGGNGASIVFGPGMSRSTGGLGLYLYTDVSAIGGSGGDMGGGVGGNIAFEPSVEDEVSVGSAPTENVIITGTINLSGGNGASSAGHGGSINAATGCTPQIAATGIRVGGSVTLDGGDASNASGARSGGIYLSTARGSAVVSASVHAVAGDGGNGVGGYFSGMSVFGVPARVTGAVTASGGEGSTQGGNAEDIAILSVGGSSVVTGTVTLTAGAGPTAQTSGNLGSVRIDTGTACVVLD